MELAGGQDARVAPPGETEVVEAVDVTVRRTGIITTPRDGTPISLHHQGMAQGAEGPRKGSNLGAAAKVHRRRAPNVQLIEHSAQRHSQRARNSCTI